MESLWNKNVYWNNLRDMFDFTKKNILFMPSRTYFLFLNCSFGPPAVRIRIKRLLVYRSFMIRVYGTVEHRNDEREILYIK
jgi:hypothetical protein